MRDMTIRSKDIPKKCIFLEDQLNNCNYLAAQAFDLDANKLIEHDADFMVKASHVNETVVRSLTINSRVFDYRIFAEKLLAHIDLRTEYVPSFRTIYLLLFSLAPNWKSVLLMIPATAISLQDLFRPHVNTESGEIPIWPHLNVLEKKRLIYFIPLLHSSSCMVRSNRIQS